MEDSSPMKLSPQELKYLKVVLERTTSYTIARGEQIDYPGLSHKKLQNKVENAIARMYT